MADSTEGQDTNVVRSGLSKVGFRETLELRSKGWVFLLAAIYASGYIVVSIYHASLGLNEINPLRPKVAAAGLLFLALGLGANYVQRHVNSFFKDPSFFEKESQRLLLLTFGGGLGAYCFDILGAIAVTLLMRFDETAFGSWLISLWIVGVLLFCISASARKDRPRLLRWATHWTFTLVCILTTLALVAMSIPHHGEFGFPQFALYLASVQLAIKIATNDFHIQFHPLDNAQWSLISAAMLMPLILFGTWVYPHTVAAFGGGEPTTAEISVLPTGGSGTVTTVSVKLVDETDAGFYVIEANDSRVRYIPRNVVTSVSFDKPKGWY